MQEGREAMKASMKRNIGNPFELKRLSTVVLILIITDDLIAQFIFMPLSVRHQAIEDELKATSALKKFASLPQNSEQLTEAASVTSATVKTNESKEFSNGKNKSALMQEGREAIKASMKRNIGNPFELNRMSTGGPDPHHH
ncbi:hypothetical protein V6N13_082018 [Hibiscus sabdariffa]